jgi:hypothetical protein
MKTSTKIIFFSLLLTTLSCGEQKFPMNIGGNYFINYDSNSLLSVMHGEVNRWSGGSIEISGEVIAWDFDSTFIIAKQIPFHDIMDSLYRKNPRMTFDETRRIYSESNLRHYWIIDRRIKEVLEWDENRKGWLRVVSPVLGPFCYEEFLDKRKELGVSDSLVFGEEKRRKF